MKWEEKPAIFKAADFKWLPRVWPSIENDSSCLPVPGDVALFLLLQSGKTQNHPSIYFMLISDARNPLFKFVASDWNQCK